MQFHGLRHTVLSATSFVLLFTLIGCGITKGPNAPESSPGGGGGRSQQDFTLSVGPSTVSIVAGTQQSVSVTATSVNGFTGTVNVGIAGLPAGVTAAPAPLALTAGTVQTITLTADPSAAPGTATATLTGTSGALVHTANLAVSVSSNSGTPPPPVPDFALKLSTSTVSIVAGSAQGISVTATPLNGFTGTVNVGVAGLPAGVVAAPATFTLIAGTPQTVTLTADSTAAASTSTVSFIGSSGTTSHTATMSLGVTAASGPPPPAADFSISVAPGAVSLTAGGGPATVAITATPQNGFSDPVTVTLNGLPAGVMSAPSTLTLTPGVAQNIVLNAGATASAGSAAIAVTGTSGTLVHTTTLALTVAAGGSPPTPDFAFSVQPATVALTAGGAGASVQASATALNGFNGAIRVAVNGLPAGITVGPASPFALTLANPQAVTFTAASSVAAGSYPVILSASSGTLLHTATVTLIVNAAPDFSLSVKPASLSITGGEAGQSFAVLATAANGFTGTVSVSLAGLPAGVTASPGTTLTLMPGVAQNVTLTASSSAKAAVATVVLTGTAGALTHIANLALTVAAAPPAADFTLSANPTAITLVQGGTTSQQVRLTATPGNGFTGTVHVTISGLPAGVTASPVIPLTPGTPSQMITFTASASAVVGNATLTFTGMSGTLTHSVSVALTVSPPPDFTLALNPTSLALAAGAAGKTLAITANAQNGFAGLVSVSISGLSAGLSAFPATLTLSPGVVQNITFTAASFASAGTATVKFTGISGALTHTTTATITVTAPPDFELELSPQSLTLGAGGPGGSVSVLDTPSNGFDGTVNVTVSGLPSGVTATPPSFPLNGSPQQVSLKAASTATAGPYTVTFTGTSGTLTHTQALTLTVTGGAPPTTGNVDVTTYHYDNARDGWNSQETTLTLANVNSSSFGKVGFYPTDGKVDGQPLYLSGVTINGAKHNVLYVVTEHDSAYAFDADSGSVLWQRSALLSDETTVDTSASTACGQIVPEIGITNTPVIDRSLGTNGAIFFVAMSSAGATTHQRLHALDLTTGDELLGGPTEITATYPGTGYNSSGGLQAFDPQKYVERVGLLLMNGNIYMGWTSHCDGLPYTGWLMMYSENTLLQESVFNLTPNGPNDFDPTPGASNFEVGSGAIWQSGAGLAGDANGNVYFLDANGAFDIAQDANGNPINGNYGNSFMKVGSSGGKLSVADYFTTYNTAMQSKDDTDLGSGGVLLLPDMADANGNTRHLAAGAGKDGNIYIVDRDNMGKFNATTPQNNIYQELDGAFSGIWGMPAYFNGTLYYGAKNDVMRAFTFSGGKLGGTPSSRTATQFAYPGTTPSVSSNGTQNGIVWGLESNAAAAAVLHAYDATNLGTELYNSNQAGGRDSFGNGNKFITPVVANGKVFVGTPNGVAVFGLLQ